MQAIVTKYLPATNTKPSRVKAQCERGSIIESWDYDRDEEGNHRFTANLLRSRFMAEDRAKYGSTDDKNPWARPFVTGCLPSGNYCHVFLPKA